MNSKSQPLNSKSKLVNRKLASVVYGNQWFHFKKLYCLLCFACRRFVPPLSLTHFFFVNRT